MIIFNILKIALIIAFGINGITFDDYLSLALLEIVERILMIEDRFSTNLSTRASKILIFFEKTETPKISEKSEDLEKVE